MATRIQAILRVAAAHTLALANLAARLSLMVTSSLVLVDLLTHARKVLMTMAQNVSLALLVTHVQAVQLLTPQQCQHHIGQKQDHSTSRRRTLVRRLNITHNLPFLALPLATTGVNLMQTA